VRHRSSTGHAGFAIVEVPAMAGDPSHPAAAGPAALTAALADAGHEAPVRRVAVPAFGGDVRAASMEVGRSTAEHVRAAVSDSALPLVLAGSCDVATAVLAGLGDTEAGVVWIDAHADFNTPSSSASGFWPGMALAAVVGDCGDDMRSALGSTPVPQHRVALVGVRSLSPEAEAERLRASAMHVVPWSEGGPRGSVEAALTALSKRAERVYVHLDLDALDPAIGAGVVDPPVPGGLSEPQLLDLLGAVRDRFEVAGATIATYTPASDDGATLPVAVAAAARLVS
jgi:arginase